jgi:hypothetical protein
MAISEIAMLKKKLPLDMLPTLDDPKACLRRAVTCERLGQRRAAGPERKAFLELAAVWREMAHELETKSGARKKHSEQSNPRTKV